MRVFEVVGEGFVSILGWNWWDVVKWFFVNICYGVDVKL